jgi:hypothetical protein
MMSEVNLIFSKESGAEVRIVSIATSVLRWMIKQSRSANCSFLFLTNARASLKQRT